MKRFTSLITCGALLLSSAAYAEDPATPTQVGKAAEEGSKSSRNWGQYAVAGIAIAVAVVALVLVAKHKGTNSSSSSSTSH